MEAAAAWSVLVEQVAGEKNKVDFGVTGDLQDLSEGVDGVLPANWVLLCIADVVIGSEQDPETAVGSAPAM